MENWFDAFLCVLTYKLLWKLYASIDWGLVTIDWMKSLVLKKTFFLLNQSIGLLKQLIGLSPVFQKCIIFTKITDWTSLSIDWSCFIFEKYWNEIILSSLFFMASFHHLVHSFSAYFVPTIALFSKVLSSLYKLNFLIHLTFTSFNLIIKSLCIIYTTWFSFLMLFEIYFHILLKSIIEDLKSICSWIFILEGE